VSDAQTADMDGAEDAVPVTMTTTDVDSTTDAPVTEAGNASLDALRDQVRAAVEARTPLIIRGGGTKDFLGQRPSIPDGSVLDTRGHAGVIDYEPTELVITARCGTPLATIESLLADHGQRLAFEPPHFGAGATLGGCIAAGLAGPGRQGAGGVRDYILGATLLDGKAEVLEFGGQVMKNVAGYDVSRLLAGSLGILGVIVSASVKVLPRPAATRTLRFALREAEALRFMNQPGALPIDASAWHDGVLCLRLSGAQAAVDAARVKLGGEVLDDIEAAAFWTSLREQTHAFFAGTAPLWRIAVAPTTPAPDLDAPQLIEWQGGQRWLRGTHEADALRATVGKAGHVQLFRADDALRQSVPVFAPLAPAALRIHRALKAGFDPAGIFNPGRLYADL